MNILLIILAVLAIWRGGRGMKRGFVDEAGRLLSLVLSLFIISVAILLYTSVKEKDTKNIILSVVIIILTGFVARLLNTLVKSLSTVAHLPVLNLLNALLGIVIGVAEIVVALWIVYVVIVSFETGEFGRQIMVWTNQSEWLRKLYDMNQLAYWMAAGL